VHLCGCYTQAGSWDGNQTSCTPTNSDYSSEQTQYSDGTLRAFNILVETSDSKQPPSEQLGGSSQLWDPAAVQNGHVARNIRLALMTVDLVQVCVVLCCAVWQRVVYAHLRQQQLRKCTASSAWRATCVF
jgi:hypothetical protein